MSHAAQRVAIINEEPLSFVCQLNKEVAAQRAFCSAAQNAVGIERAHIFPWKVRACLENGGVSPRAAVVDEYTGLIGRRKIVRLWAGWRDGTRLDIQFLPSADLGDYWGVYRMVIWRP